MHADSTLQIDLDAIASNAAVLHELCDRQTLCGVLKADAYGLGAHAIAPVLEAAGWSLLAVHRIDEALALLDHVSVPLLVLGPVRGLTPLHPLAAPLGDGRVQLVIQDGAALDDVRGLAHAMSRPIGVHLEVDTGMGRGVHLNDAANMLRGMLADPRLVTHGVMSHFTAAADQERTRSQFAAFDRMLLPMRRRLPVTCRRHIAATTAALRDADVRGDMVRIGLGWAGHAVGLDDQLHLSGAVRWQASIASVRAVPSGTAVGYGGRHVCVRDARLAMVPVGYADGLPVQATGQRLTVRDATGETIGTAPIVGTVAMDQVMIDVTHLSAAVDAGTSVEVFGPETFSAFAGSMGLQPHHLLTSIGPRVHRRLISSAGATRTHAVAAG